MQPITQETAPINSVAPLTNQGFTSGGQNSPKITPQSLPAAKQTSTPTNSLTTPPQDKNNNQNTKIETETAKSTEQKP